MKKIVLCSILLFGFRIHAQIFAGFSAGLETNKVLRTSYPFGIDIDLKHKKNTYGFYFNLNMGSSPRTTLTIEDKSNTYNIDNISSGIFCLEYGRHFFENYNFLFETVAGLGYKNTTYYQDEKQNLDYGKDSVVLSAGLSLRYITNSDFYIELKPMYCYTNHHHHLLSEKTPSNIFRLNIVLGTTIGN